MKIKYRYLNDGFDCSLKKHKNAINSFVRVDKSDERVNRDHKNAAQDIFVIFSSYFFVTIAAIIYTSGRFSYLIIIQSENIQV